MSLKRPKLLVFDLDYTLWPFWVDTHVNPPFRKSSNDHIVDSSGAAVKCYPEVQDVLKKLHEEGYAMAVASRTGEVKGAKQLIDLFGWKEYFKYLQIYPGSKTTHFNINSMMSFYTSASTGLVAMNNVVNNSGNNLQKKNPAGKQLDFVYRIKEESGIDFNEMIFFDDEGRNIRDVGQMGVLSIMVKNGVTKNLVDDALSKFSSKWYKGLFFCFA